jgi:hypothetical protein
MNDAARIAAFLILSVAASALLFWIGAHLSGGCYLRTIASVFTLGC